MIKLQSEASILLLDLLKNRTISVDPLHLCLLQISCLLVCALNLHTFQIQGWLSSYYNHLKQFNIGECCKIIAFEFTKFYKGERRFRKQLHSRYLQLTHSISNTLYLDLVPKSQSLCVGCNLFFSLYLELSLYLTNTLVPCEFEIERVNCICKNVSVS